MRKGVKISLILSGVIFGAGLFLAGTGFALGGLHSVAYASGTGLIVMDEERMASGMEHIDASYGDVSSISIDTSGFVRVRVEVGGEELRVRGSNHAVYGGLRATEEDGILKISSSPSSIFSGFNLGFLLSEYRGDLVISVPPSLHLESFSADMSAADLEIAGLHTRKLSLHPGASDIELRDVHCEYTTLNIAAGDVSVIDSELGDLSANIAAGSLHVTGCEAIGAQIDISAGEARLSGYFTGSFRINVKMGDLRITNALPRTNAALRINASMSDISIDGAKYRGEEGRISATSTEKAFFDIDAKMSDVLLEFSRG